MNQLNKLIQQYEADNPGKRAEIWEGPCFYGYTKEFMEWQLASRPTCGEEQRKFLDEVEKFNYRKVNIGTTDECITSNDCGVIIWQSKFIADLQKVIQGE
ncbi:unnamed protein product [Leptospira phage LE1]|uniref:Uncharacterized protein n=1 Tax=Leptospira phage LE1 TaxID=137511 RepID=Q6NDY5_9CAUD|nr:hypothetical protein HWD53_gp58 [Leptospira phage LE1]CAE14754.1 unnamed protein product [Leptospira phage LE1]